MGAAARQRGWALPDSREVSAALRCIPMDFAAWSRFASAGRDDAVAAGRAVLAYEGQCVERAVKHAAPGFLAGYCVPVLNATHLISETLNALAKGQAFAASWFQAADGRYVYSLRSDADGGIDVSAVARCYGGGGHARAAGFTAPALMHARMVTP